MVKYNSILKVPELTALKETFHLWEAYSAYCIQTE